MGDRKMSRMAKAAKVAVAKVSSDEGRVRLTQEQIESWMPPIARGLIPLDDAAEKLGIGRKQLSAYLGNWKRRQKREAIKNVVDRLPGVDVVAEEKKAKARKAKNARQRERRAKAREHAKLISPEVGVVQDGLEYLVSQEPTAQNTATT